MTKKARKQSLSPNEKKLVFSSYLISSEVRALAIFIVQRTLEASRKIPYEQNLPTFNPYRKNGFRPIFNDTITGIITSLPLYETHTKKGQTMKQARVATFMKAVFICSSLRMWKTEKSRNIMVL